MGIALLSVSSMLSQLGTWIAKPQAKVSTHRPSLRIQRRVMPQEWARQTVNGRSAGLRLTPHSQATPLRVVRLSEAGSAPEAAGRMRISGRMADVCAELDRLAAKEAQILSH